MSIDATASDGDLVRQARAGDVGAFERLYRAHAPAVSALTRRMAGDADEAREMVQDIFVHAWQHLGAYHGRSAFATWLHRLGVNVILTRFRAAKRDADRWVPDGDAVIDARPSTDAGLDARMDLDAALLRLPAGARIVIVLHDIHGYSHDEIAQMTGIAAGTSRAQLWRARRHLMRLLDV